MNNEKRFRLYGDLTSMGKTVPSYRMAHESEIQRWNGLARALRFEEYQAFDKLMDACRNYAATSCNATNPVIFEHIAMSFFCRFKLP